VVPLFARVRPVFEAPLEVDKSRIEPGPLGGRLAIRSLSFRYAADGPWILQDIDFAVEPGECVAIVGASGSGKSTMMRLLLGFESPTRGGVYYDDRDLETLDLRLLRRQVGTVMESSKLVPGSLFENIAGGAPLTTAQVEEAVRLAGLEADVANMPTTGLPSASCSDGRGLAARRPSPSSQCCGGYPGRRRHTGASRSTASSQAAYDAVELVVGQLAARGGEGRLLLPSTLGGRPLARVGGRLRRCSVRPVLAGGTPGFGAHHDDPRPSRPSARPRTGRPRPCRRRCTS
jgi:hypothetical protein